MFSKPKVKKAKQQPEIKPLYLKLKPDERDRFDLARGNYTNKGFVMELVDFYVKYKPVEASLKRTKKK